MQLVVGVDAGEAGEHKVVRVLEVRLGRAGRARTRTSGVVWVEDAQLHNRRRVDRAAVGCGRSIRVGLKCSTRTFAADAAHARLLRLLAHDELILQLARRHSSSSQHVGPGGAAQSRSQPVSQRRTYMYRPRCHGPSPRVGAEPPDHALSPTEPCPRRLRCPGRPTGPGPDPASPNTPRHAGCALRPCTPHAHPKQLLKHQIAAWSRLLAPSPLPSEAIMTAFPIAIQPPPSMRTGLACCRSPKHAYLIPNSRHHLKLHFVGSRELCDPPGPETRGTHYTDRHRSQRSTRGVATQYHTTQEASPRQQARPRQTFPQTETLQSTQDAATTCTSCGPRHRASYPRFPNTLNLPFTRFQTRHVTQGSLRRPERMYAPPTANSTPSAPRPKYTISRSGSIHSFASRGTRKESSWLPPAARQG
jgi:hypothetical protein